MKKKIVNILMSALVLTMVAGAVPANAANNSLDDMAAEDMMELDIEDGAIMDEGEEIGSYDMAPELVKGYSDEEVAAAFNNDWRTDLNLAGAALNDETATDVTVEALEEVEDIEVIEAEIEGLQEVDSYTENLSEDLAVEITDYEKTVPHTRATIVSRIEESRAWRVYRKRDNTCSGVIGTHIIIQGIGKILEQNMSYAFNYTARK